MPLITFPVTFSPGTRAKSSEVNSNFAEINTWLAAGSIEASYIDTLTSEIVWNIGPAANKAISITQGTDENSVEITQSMALAVNGFIWGIEDNANQTASGASMVSLISTGLTSTAPAVKMDIQGSRPWVYVQDNGVDRWRISRASGEVKYESFSSDVHKFYVGGVANASINATGFVLQTDAVATANIQALAVTTPKIAAQAVTRAKLESIGEQLGGMDPSEQIFVTATYATVTGLSVNITTSGRPVKVMLMPDTTDPSFIQHTHSTGSDGFVKIDRDSDTVTWEAFYTAPAGSTVKFPPYQTIWDTPAAGSHTYRVQARRTGSGVGNNLTLRRIKIIAYEL